MQTTKHFTRTDAINEAKRIFGASFKDSVKIEHDGAFWVLSEQLYQITQEGRVTGPKYAHNVALELLEFKSKYDKGFQVYKLQKAA
jgi:hypothetical protein